MSSPFRIEDGKCNSCSEQIDDNEVMTCFRCKLHFHAICKGSNAICNKSLLNLFHQRSTKRNFTWYCDECITQLEVDTLDSAAPYVHKFNGIESKIDVLNNKVSSITDLLNGGQLPPHSVVTPDVSVTGIASSGPGSNVWQNTSKVMIMKSNLGSANLDELEQKIVGEQIQVTNSRRRVNGDIVITCPTSAAAQKIKEIATELLPNHTIKDPLVKFSWINVVGFESNHSIEALYEMLVKNNVCFEFLNGKPQSDVKEFLEIKAVKPCLKNPNIFRALLKVSSTLRQVIKRYKDKLRIGLYSCRVYDQAPQIKRCNKCQRFGHWVAECSPENGKACCKCGSLEHESMHCNDSSIKRCINCIRANIVNQHPAHTADSSTCPCFNEFRKSAHSGGTGNRNMRMNQRASTMSTLINPVYYHGNGSSSHVVQNSGVSLQQHSNPGVSGVQQHSIPHLLPNHYVHAQQGNVFQQQLINDAPLNRLGQAPGYM